MDKKFNVGDRVRSKFYGIVGSVIDVDTDGYIIEPDHVEEMWIAEEDAEAYDRKTDFLTRLSELMREFDVSFIAHKTDMPISAYFKDDEIPFARLGKENNKGCGVIITPPRQHNGLRQGMRASKAKYGNSKVCIDGITFDSKREGNVYLRLKDLQSRGCISDLQIHPKWELQPKLTETYVKHLKTKDKECERTVLLPITYEADFAFYHNGRYVVVDVKISKSLLPKEYQIKKKMMRYVHGITLTEIYALKDLAQFEKEGQI